MGIVNVTPDSFSDGGEYYGTDKAVTQAMQLVAEGADILDIGGESSRPGAEPVSLEEELRRTIPVIAALRSKTDIPISIDTYKGEVARAALEAGADMINDISALRFDPSMAKLAAETEAPVILMHMQGTPRDMQQHPHYEDCVAEIGSFFAERIEFCRNHGIAPDRLILDPGIGFGKRLEDNLAILRGLEAFKRFGRPILVGASRKAFIAGVRPKGGVPSDRLGGSVAAALVAVRNGARIARVHDVAPTVEAISLWRAIEEQA
jgi:dihydropteroate synthase